MWAGEKDFSNTQYIIKMRFFSRARAIYTVFSMHGFITQLLVRVLQRNHVLLISGQRHLQACCYVPLTHSQTNEKIAEIQTH